MGKQGSNLRFYSMNLAHSADNENEVSQGPIRAGLTVKYQGETAAMYVRPCRFWM